MAKILVADDEADLELLIRQKFRRQIREAKFEFVFALNGVQALEVLQQHPDTELLLTDINMPEMDGLSLLEKIKENTPMLQSVIVSAYGDMQNIRTAMNRGAFDFVTKPVNFEDLEITIEKTLSHVAQLKKTIQAIRENNILRMYVDDNVLNFMGTHEYEKKLEANENIEATVAFIDLCSFTSYSEREKPDKVVTMLNRYFDIMVKELLAQEATIDKFMGDCVMAVFKGAYHLDRAIEACLAIRNLFFAMPEENGFAPRVSIGIHSGEMISGNIGALSLRRLDYTVIGDVVNTAQRLQSLANPCQVLIDAGSYEQIKHSFECKLIGSRQLKNKSTDITIYEVVN